MSLPSDSVAFSRFNNGRSFSGDPDYDPKAFIRENILPVETKARSVTPPYADYNAYKPYPDSPPPVKVIPDPVRELVEKPIPEPEVPVTVFPTISPPEAITFFMPAPVPTEVVVEDERPLVEAVPMTPPPMKSGAFSLPVPVLTEVVVEDERPLVEAVPMTPPPMKSGAFSLPVPVQTIVYESPEVYHIPYAEIFDNRLVAPPYPATSRAVTVLTLEPENPFPDVSGPYTDPIEYGGHPGFALYEITDYEITDNEAYMAGDPDTMDDPEDSIAYFAPDFEYNIPLVDVNCIVNEEEIPDVSPEPLDISSVNIPLVNIPQGFDINELEDVLFNDELAETSLVYAEPGLDDTVNIVDEARIISEGEPRTLTRTDSDLTPEASYPYEFPDEFIIENELYEAILQDVQADASLAYAEPEVNGAVDLAESPWDIESGEERLIKDIEDEDTVETVYPGEFPAEAAADELHDAILREEDPDTSLVYAEPGIGGPVDLADGLWDIESGEERLIKDIEDEDTVETVYPGEFPAEASADELHDAILREEDPDTSLVYAEPGIGGPVDLADGLWNIESGEERLIKDIEDEDTVETVYPGEFPAEASADELHDAILREEDSDTSLVYAEPGVSGPVDLVDGLWILKDSERQEAPPEALYPDGLPSEGDSSELYDAILREGRPTVEYPVTQSYLLDYILDFNAVLPENEAMARNIYDTIVSIESAPDRPPEVIIYLGPVSEDKSAGMMQGASLRLIKRLSNGKYYLQIGLFDRTEILARKLTSLDWVYPYALETYGDLQSKKYKLLVGPLNEGESNALLLRFKRGYPDAFIRRDG
jgi:tRNA(Ser,Leu) C12 N-acetylase TAN1